MKDIHRLGDALHRNLTRRTVSVNSYLMAYFTFKKTLQKETSHNS
jgi:hypothetical protein